jgi:hypothetical protein
MATKAMTRGKKFGLRKVGTLVVIREVAILAEDTPAADILAADTQVVDIRGDPGAVAAVVTQAGVKAEAQETLKTIPKSSRSFILAHRS